MAVEASNGEYVAVHGPSRLDEVDERLVALLRRDGRCSYSQLAREVGMSEASVRQRVKRLLADGVMRVIAVVDPYKLGSTLDVMMNVSVELAKLDAFLAEAKGFAELRYLARMAGEFNVMMSALFRDVAHMDDFLNRLGRVEGIRRYTLMPVLKVFKRTYDWVTPGLM